jgi:hypothetical protein
MILLDKIRLKKKELEREEDQLLRKLSSIITNITSSKNNYLPISASFMVLLFQQIDIPKEEENNNNNLPQQSED